MEDSLKLSIPGLKRIDQARKLKGWNRQSSSWAQAALTTVSTLKQFWRRERIQRDTFIRICEAVDLPNWRELVDTRPHQTTISDWFEAPEVHFFCDRELELAQLEQWILDDKAKLVGLLGLGGMGKTTLAVKLIEQIHSEFEYVIWRSLQSTPQLKDLLLEFIHFFSSPQQRPMNRLRRLLAPRNLEVQPPIFSHLEEQDSAALLALLMSQLREHRCLMILDDLDSLLKSAALNETPNGAESHLGDWKTEASGYQHLLKRISQERHQSCLLVISREPTRGLAPLNSDTPTLYLKGISASAGAAIVQKFGATTATPSQWQALVRYYDGNPFILKVVADVISRFMQGDLGAYLHQITDSSFTPADIRDWLNEHLTRLSPGELEILNALAIAHHPLTLEELQQLVTTPNIHAQVINHLAALDRRSLLHHEGKTFGLSPMIQTHIRQSLAASTQT